MLTNGGEARVLGENSPLALALPKALGRVDGLGLARLRGH
jgi:hypothetical protein